VIVLKPLSQAMKSIHLVLVALSGFVLQSCVAMPVVLNGGSGEVELGHFPVGSKHAELEVEDGSKLRGVYVPADDPRAPIVLHLLRSSGSVTFGAEHAVLFELNEMGIASLMLDYRGVGASSGSRSSANLEADAIAMYGEAVRLAGGIEDRVYVRSASLGTLATALILKDGANPAGISMAVPVRSETMMQHYLKLRMPWLIRAIAQLPFTNPIDVDILQQLRRSTARLMVHTASNEYYLPGEEMNWMRQAVEDAGGDWFRVEGNHYEIAIQSRRMFPAERGFYEAAPLAIASAVPVASAPAPQALGEISATQEEE